MDTQMHNVTSSNVTQVGHDGVNLLVTFNNGSKYQYLGVPENELMNLLARRSKSPGPTATRPLTMTPGEIRGHLHWSFCCSARVRQLSAACLSATTSSFVGK